MVCMLARIRRLHRLRMTALPTDLPVIMPKRELGIPFGFTMILNKLFEKDFPSRLTWL